MIITIIKGLAIFFCTSLLLLNLYESRGYKGLPPMTRKKKLFNVLWWFKNDRDPVTGATHDLFLTDKPDWVRKIGWAIRNPLNNFTFFVAGLADSPFMERYQAHDEQGKERQWPVDDGMNVRPPFASYRYKWIEGYAGWKPNGQLSVVPIRKYKSKSY